MAMALAGTIFLFHNNVLKKGGDGEKLLLYCLLGGIRQVFIDECHGRGRLNLSKSIAWIWEGYTMKTIIHKYRTFNTLYISAYDMLSRIGWGKIIIP